MCLAEHRDIGQVLAMYSTDFGGFWPSPMEYNEADSVWAVRFRGKTYNMSHQPSPQDYLTIPSLWRAPLIDRYYGGDIQSEAFICPSDLEGFVDDRGVYAMRNNGEEDRFVGSDRVVSLALHVAPSLLKEDGPLEIISMMRTRRIFETKFPSQKATIYESSPFHTPQGYTDDMNVPIQGLTAHTVLAADGAASVRHQRDTQLGVMFTNLPNGMWYPGITEFERRAVTSWDTTRDGVRGRDW